MDFEFNTDLAFKIEDSDLTDLLTTVYVEGGFTEPEQAKNLFDAAAVRQRGVLIGAREKDTGKLAGVVIFVPPASQVRRLATGNEAEMHLLGVKSKYRGLGLGRKLVEKIIAMASSERCAKILLWTQVTMVPAQKLYESFGFIRLKTFEQGGRTFFVYSLDL